MLDAHLRRLIDPPLNRWGRRLAARGVTADGMTLFGFGLGLLAAVTIALGAPGLALVPLLLSRLADGLDGAIARATRKTGFGGYLDISVDFLFYGAVPLAFVFADPTNHGLAGAFLLASFYFNGSTFLGFAILAEKHGMQTEAQGKKSHYHSGGLVEGTETIILFAAVCLWPQCFNIAAWGFGIAAFIGGGLRIAAARRLFQADKPGPSV